MCVCVCAACQCNGHSRCVNGSVCENCGNLTAGTHCQNCMAGYYGDPVNGGKCNGESIYPSLFLSIYSIYLSLYLSIEILGKSILLHLLLLLLSPIVFHKSQSLRIRNHTFECLPADQQAVMGSVCLRGAVFQSCELFCSLLGEGGRKWGWGREQGSETYLRHLSSHFLSAGEGCCYCSRRRPRLPRR